jgi:hypothetical protein
LKRKKRKKPESPMRPRQVRVALQRVEITAGHDGLLRGKPEPVILLFAYCVGGGVTTFLGQELLRLHPKKPFPAQLALPEEVAISVDVRQHEGVQAGSHLLVLALALEEDSSADVQHLYKRLSTPESLFLWDSASPIPAPVTLANTRRWMPADAAQVFAVHLMDGVVDVGEQCSGDNFVAAQAVLIGFAKGPADCWLRFVSADRRNDWTAWLAIKC